MVDQSSPEIKSELELLRKRNIEARDAYLASLIANDPEFGECMGLSTSRNRTSTTRKRSASTDPTFKSSAYIPLERRRSARLQNKSPIFTKDDLIDEASFKKHYLKKGVNDYSDLENIVYEPRESKENIKRKMRYSPRIPVELVTELMINNISRKVSSKVRSEAGTSCHQCRQKTTDQKTCCRNKDCVGIRGQFCGVCLENRYGEDAAKALMDPEWHCPVCRGICNCSFCRAKAGKRPTGILTPQALQAGHKSVKDFLDSLRGEGDYPHRDDLREKYNNPGYLLGFSEDLSIAHMGGGLQHKIDCTLTLEKMNDLLQQFEQNLMSPMVRYKS